MTLRTWLSSNNVSHQKSKMTVGVSVVPAGNNVHESPTRECALPTVCGGLKLRNGRNWKTKSVEDGLEGVEQGDYGFLEYFSTRRSGGKEAHIDSGVDKTYDSWNQFQSSWSQRTEWSKYTPAQFYPGTLNRQDTTSRKRSRKDRPQSFHQDVQRQNSCLFREEDLCTSTPLSSPHREIHSFRHSFERENALGKPKNATGLLKRNSVLAKLRPDRWHKGAEGSLRRCHSKDDVLSSPNINNMAMSQPDLLLSHNTFKIDEMSSLTNLSVPAPLSILPPTCRNAAANVSQTLPRRRRASDTNKENTLLARGKKWLTAAVTNKENDNPKHHSFSCHRIKDLQLDPYLDGSGTSTLKPVPENIFQEPSRKLAPNNLFKEKMVGNLYLAQEKHPLERLRCRRPLTFYLLEDYLSPVKRRGGDIELDEFLGRTPRVLFSECPQRPLPPTPEWDTPSLSPPASLVSGSSHPYDHGGSSGPISPTKEGRFKMEDSSLFHASDQNDKPPSPVFSPKESELYPQFRTPDNSLADSKSQWRNHSTMSPQATSPPAHSHHQYLHATSPEKRPQIYDGMLPSDQFSPYSRVHSNSLSYSKSSSSHSHSHSLSHSHSMSHSHIGSMTNLHSMDYTTSTQFTHQHPHSRPDNNAPCIERRPSNAKDRRKIRSSDVNKKSPGQQKEALQRPGRSGTSVNKNQVPGKTRQNGLVSSQKLPALSNNNNSSASRMNLPLENSRLGLSDGESHIQQGGHSSSRLSSGPLPILNNNKGEILSEYPIPKVTNNKNLDDPSYPKEKKNINLHHKPQEAVRLFGDRLTAYEKREIESYPEIWYLGLDARKIHGEEGAQLNGGYDDENGSYNKVMHDHISYRYEILEVIGKGSFGQVIRAIDHKSGDQVAIKIIRNKKRFHHQALVEVKILDHLRKKDCDNYHNVIHMLDYFYFRNHLCITFELMGLNLYELIKKNSYQGFGLSIIKRFAFSLVQCMKLLAKENIIHCDLKPENVLLKDRGGTSIRVIDFGSSCYTHQRVYTYIQSRFYRSPEVILGLPYGLAIDMWSLGCILAELYTGYPLFPGENEVEQLACIMEAMGLPPQHLLMNASRRRLFFDSKGSPRCVTNSKGKKRRPGSRELSSVLKSPDPNFVNFITRCLDWDPSQRLTPDDALQHEWLQSSISTTPTSYSSTIDRKPNGTTNITRRPGPLMGGDSTENEGAVNTYRVYKSKKRDTSTTRVSVGASRSTDGGGVSPPDAIVTVNNNNLGKSLDSKEKEDGVQPPSIVNDAGSENSLDDSGTFLPPIL